MDKEWAEKNKEVQALLSKEATFKDAIRKLIGFREEMLSEIKRMVEPRTAHPRTSGTPP